MVAQGGDVAYERGRAASLWVSLLLGHHGQGGGEEGGRGVHIGQHGHRLRLPALLQDGDDFTKLRTLLKTQANSRGTL